MVGSDGERPAGQAEEFGLYPAGEDPTTLSNSVLCSPLKGCSMKPHFSGPSANSFLPMDWSQSPVSFKANADKGRFGNPFSRTSDLLAPMT